ncbi:MAG: hypothetical protein Q7S92_01910 [Candidatus Diapherotrites archaeon]|nr:hypothetical protein [Candidatus Diapherotrites archaeon]
MVFIRAKRFGRQTYYYLVENKRVNGRVLQKVKAYLGKNRGEGNGFNTAMHGNRPERI